MSEGRMPQEWRDAISEALEDGRCAMVRLRKRVGALDAAPLHLPEAAVWTVLSILISEHLWTRAQADGRTGPDAVRRAEEYLKKLVDVIIRDVARYMPKEEDQK